MKGFQMIRRSIGIVTFAVIAFASALIQAEGSQKDTKEADPEEISCKFKKVVDSRIPQKICLTNFEWEERRRAQIEAKRSSRNKNSVCGDSGPC